MRLGGGDEIDAAEKFPKAGAGDLVVDAHASSFTDKQASSFHHREMLRESRDITASKSGEVIHTAFSSHQRLHHKKARRVGHCLHDEGATSGVSPQCCWVRWHIW